jgi:hypothetical protein
VSTDREPVAGPSEAIPKLPRGRGIKLSGPELFRIALTLMALVGVIVLTKPCANAVSGFVTSFDQGSDREMPMPGSVDVPAQHYEQLEPGMTEQEIKAAIERAKAKAAGTSAEPVGSDLPAAGSGTPPTGTDLPAAGSGTPGVRSDLPAAGSGTPPRGTDLPAAGSGTPPTGTDLPAAGSGTPSRGTDLPAAGSATSGVRSELPAAGSATPRQQQVGSAADPGAVR